eukprot:tig00000949_g5752.t1
MNTTDRGRSRHTEPLLELELEQPRHASGSLATTSGSLPSAASRAARSCCACASARRPSSRALPSCSRASRSAARSTCSAASSSDARCPAAAARSRCRHRQLMINCNSPRQRDPECNKARTS